MANPKLTLKKRNVQLLKRPGGQIKPSLTNVAVCSGCHGCTHIGNLGKSLINKIKR